jgi:hypothetical protein
VSQGPCIVVYMDSHDDAEISRTPPTAVRRQLRQEVGFGCPVSGCGNPYLEYHHFDPPWEEEHHHDPARMIALCATHHAQAAAWTPDQTRAMKGIDPERPDITGRFEWMREDLLAVVGGNYFYETPNMVVFRSEPMIWFERDADRRMLLNLRVLTASGEPRARLVNNDWIIRGDPTDVESPPNGSRLRIRYATGDELAVRFREWSDATSLSHVHPRAVALGPMLSFPLVTAEITVEVGGVNIKFGPTSTQIRGTQITGCVAAHCANGFLFG